MQKKILPVLDASDPCQLCSPASQNPAPLLEPESMSVGHAVGTLHNILSPGTPVQTMHMQTDRLAGCVMASHAVLLCAVTHTQSDLTLQMLKVFLV